LQRALADRGWQVAFFERDVPYYAQNRDLQVLPNGELILYDHWKDIEAVARGQVAESDVAMVTSYCPDGAAASDLVLSAARPRRVFYDLDTPITLASLQQAKPTTCIGAAGLSDFDIVLSFTGGPALKQLELLAGARRTATLYGHVDPQKYFPGRAQPRYCGDLSYIGTYAADRQNVLRRLFIESARRRADLRFVLAGAQYPETFPWTENIYFVRHLPPSEHPSFYASSRLTLNVTRREMAMMGWCPSGRLFEAGACGTPVITDYWTGLDTFFEPGREIIVAHSDTDVIAALELSDFELRRIGNDARARVLAEHTSAHRAAEFERLLADTPHQESRQPEAHAELRI
jgi:spore maturation protein CgeB